MGLFSIFNRAPKLYTGQVIDASEMRTTCGTAYVTLRKMKYAVVNPDAVIWLAQQARDALWKQGINQWQPNATCTLFAAKFMTLGNELFYANSFYERAGSAVNSSGPLALGAGMMRFVPDASPYGHAIGAAITPDGLKLVDPQAPDRLYRALSLTELNSRAFDFL